MEDEYPSVMPWEVELANGQFTGLTNDFDYSPKINSNIMTTDNK